MSYADMLRDPRWAALRAEILELDGARCVRCGRGRDDGCRMHVHHREYVRGLKPWEYPSGMLEVLCAGYHAAEHGVVPPRFGWTLVYEDDRGSLCEECELCSEPIRYVFTVYHEHFGFIDVGTVCCDRMTGTEEASALVKMRSRRERFLSSTRWARRAKSLAIKQSGAWVYVFATARGYMIRMIRGGASVLGKRTYASENEAKSRAFDVLESGQVDAVLPRREWADQ